jgi:hypothetical protein
VPGNPRAGVRHDRDRHQDDQKTANAISDHLACIRAHVQLLPGQPAVARADGPSAPTSALRRHPPAGIHQSGPGGPGAFRRLVSEAISVTARLGLQRDPRERFRGVPCSWRGCAGVHRSLPA